MAYDENWVFDRVSRTVTEIDKKNLQKAKNYENEMLKKGYRWFTINKRTKILVECDSKGNPTKKGKNQLMIAKTNIGEI